MYNGIGNLVSVKAYGYTPAGTELSGTPTTTALNYNDSANPDRLTSYKGKSITYDANGGVATYDGCDYSWNKGKLNTIYRGLGGSLKARVDVPDGPFQRQTNFVGTGVLDGP